MLVISMYVPDLCTKHPKEHESEPQNLPVYIHKPLIQQALIRLLPIRCFPNA